MKYLLTSLFALSAVMATSGAYANDIDGAKLAKQTCFSCHNFTDEKRTKTGPNLFNIVGMTPGTQENFTRYTPALVEIGGTGIVWDDALLTEYLADPTGFLQSKSTNPKARSAMVFRKLSEDEVSAIVVYLNTLKSGE